MSQNTEYMDKLLDPQYHFVLQDDSGDRGIAGIIHGGKGVLDRIAQCIYEELDCEKGVLVKITDIEYGYEFKVEADYVMEGTPELRDFKLIQAPLY